MTATVDPALLAFLRSIVSFSTHPGSKSSRPPSFWTAACTAALGRPVDPAEIKRAFLAVPGVVVDHRGESNVASLASLVRAATLYPAVFSVSRKSNGRPHVQILSASVKP